jgi:glutamate-5-semialdehyde dehydrogenase
MKNVAKASKEASLKLLSLDHSTRKQILNAIANQLADNTKLILEANQKDLNEAKANQLPAALYDRLLLDEKRIQGMINGVLEIANQAEVVGQFEESFTNNQGLIIKKQRIPLGVILMIFESRPNVVVDCAALAIKSSNAIILKGGKEAKYSNQMLGQIIQNAIAPFIPKESVQVLASDKREMLDELLTLKDYIDVVIPRGGEKLIEHVYNHSKIPVIAHYKGLCHIYIDQFADAKKSCDIVINAKTQRPGVCNAVETLLVHQDVLPILESLLSELQKRKTELRLEKDWHSHFPQITLQEAHPEDWDTEYLANILSIKIVKNIEEAIAHIQLHGSHHTEAIITENEANMQLFMNSIDASCLVWNASTRFNDGGQLGLGAELGISTTKLHAYGPMGAREMTTTRFIVIGQGHVRL